MVIGRTRAAVKAAVASYITRGLSLLIGFVVTPIVLSYLGRELYGYWAIVGSVLGYLGMADFGITGSVGTMIARAQEDKTGREVSWIASNSFVAHSASGLLVLFAGLVVAWMSPIVLRVPLSLRLVVGSALALASVALAVTFPARTLKAVLRGTQYVSTVKVAEFMLFLVRTGLVLTLLAAGLSLLALPVASLAVGVASLGVFYLVVRRLIPEVGLVWSDVSLERIRRILAISMWWFLGALGALLIYQTDNLVVGRYLGPASVTVYALTLRLAEIARIQIYELNFAVTPGIGDLVGRGDLARVREVYFFSLRLMLFLSVSAGILIFLFNGAFVALWVGSENFGGHALSAVFALTLVYLVLFHTSSMILTNMLDLKVLAQIRAVEGVLNLVLSLVLIRYLGLLGVALGTLVAGLATTGWLVPKRACRLLGISGADLMRTVATKLAVFLAFALPISLLVRQLGPGEGFGALFMRVFLVSASLFVAGSFTLFSVKEIRVILQSKKVSND